MEYINRDISWLSFNHRVLKEAGDESVPLMERVKFLSIFSSNMDEFFRVRYPILSFYSLLKNKTLHKLSSAPATDRSVVVTAQEMIDEQLEEFGRIMNQRILPELEEAGVVLYYNKAIPPAFQSSVKEIFFTRVLSFIQPVFLHHSLEKFKKAESNRIYLLVSLEKKGQHSLEHALVNIPTDKLPRFFTLESRDEKQHIVFIDDIIRENLPFIFSGFHVRSSYSFKITRDSELYLDEENLKEDILEQLENKLPFRDMGKASRLLYEPGMPLALRNLITDLSGLNESQIFEGGRYHNLADLSGLPVSRKELYYPRFRPVKALPLDSGENIFKAITEKDILLHFPYHSYNPVLALFNQAAIDPAVTSIYITLYRVASDSHIVNALISAARNQKEVVVFVELKARFDEANNIKWSKKMKKAGVKIIYSMPGIKVHSKIALIRRKEGNSIRDFAFVGTGNFNETTARFYTDHALLTTETSITRDLLQLFERIKKRNSPVSKPSGKPDTILVSRQNMTDVFRKEIGKQISIRKKGGPALIRIKVNNLEDKEVIDLLYKASRAGVPVQLMVRGICCLRDGVPELSENIESRRIVDRFLEHSRIFLFGPPGAATVYFGSADLMSRNLHRRIEVCIPVLQESIREQFDQYFDIQWQDAVKAATHRGTPVPANGAYPPVRAQQEIYHYIKQLHEMVPASRE